MGGLVFFSTTAAFFFLASGDCGARLPAPRRGNDALYSRAYFFGGGRPGVDGSRIQGPWENDNWDRVGKPRVLHELVGFFTFWLGIFHQWVNGYGDCWNIPIPPYPMGKGFGPFTYPWVVCLVHI